MSKLKKILLFLLFVSWISPVLHADQKKKSSLCYVKLGAAHPPGPPGDSSEIFPTVGLGVRFQRGYYGLDLSANLSSVIVDNYAVLKGLFLYYPRPEKKHQYYVGIGPGIGYYESWVPMFASHSCSHVTIEGVLGREFRHARHFKTFIQLELSQPAVRLGGHEHHCSNKPGVALTVGLGF